MRDPLASVLSVLGLGGLASLALAADPAPSGPSPAAAPLAQPVSAQPVPQALLPGPGTGHPNGISPGPGGGCGCRPFAAYGFEVCRGLILYSRHDSLAPLMWQGDPHNCGLVSPFFCGRRCAFGHPLGAWPPPASRHPSAADAEHQAVTESEPAGTPRVSEGRWPLFGFASVSEGSRGKADQSGGFFSLPSGGGLLGGGALFSPP